MRAAAAATGTTTVPRNPKTSRAVDRCSSGTRSTIASCTDLEATASAYRQICRDAGRALDQQRPMRTEC